MSSWLEGRMAPVAIGPAGWLRVVARGVPLFALTYGGLLVLLMVRLIEAPLAGRNRPVTPRITRFVCRNALRIMGIRLVVRGTVLRDPGAMVANHAAWLDIFVLNAVQCIYFVSKSEVAGWPGIGWLARATGTVFINRRGTEAKVQQQVLEDRLRAGHHILFFPEGTSSDSRRILPFKSTLFAAFFTHGMEDVVKVQPVTVVYVAPKGADPRFYGWWGDMDFGGSLIRMLAAPRQGRAEVILHAPVSANAFADRKALAAHCERVIRAAHPDGAA